MKTGQEARKAREVLGMNQTEFWSRVKVNQSAASRYESGRNMPAAVQVLLVLAYGTDSQAQKTLAALRKQK